MNKNNRLALLLKNVVADFNAIIEVLEEKESVTAPNPYPVGSELHANYEKLFPLNQKKVTSSRGVSYTANAGSISIPITIEDSTVLVGKHVSLYNYSNGWIQRIYPPTNMKYDLYKIIKGKHEGAVVRVDKKTQLIVEDGRFLPQNVDSSTRTHRWVGMVSYDADGIGYVNDLMRPWLSGEEKISRMYRPKGSNGHYAYVDVYFADARN